MRILSFLCETESPVCLPFHNFATNYDVQWMIADALKLISRNHLVPMRYAVLVTCTNVGWPVFFFHTIELNYRGIVKNELK